MILFKGSIVLFFFVFVQHELMSQAIGSILEEVKLNYFLLRDSNHQSNFIRSDLEPLYYNDSGFRKPFIIRPVNPFFLFQYNQSHPYNWNDGALFPTSGNQQLITFGARGQFKKISFKISPEIILAQNDVYDGFFPDHDPVTWRDYYRYYNYIETPERFGILPLRKVYGGQSHIRFTHKAISLEASTANKWWGPGQRNALLLSNNAPGIPHISFKSNKPIVTSAGSVSFELLYGINFNANYPPADSSKVFRNYKLYYPKNDIQRFMKGFIFAWQPKWLKGISLGMSQMDMRYVYDSKQFSQWIPFQKPFHRFILDEQNKSLLLSALFFNYQIPKYQMRLYAEFGWNNNERNFRDFILNPERGMASVMGFKKLFPISKDHYWELNAELTNLQLQMLDDVFTNKEPQSWYLHKHVRQGYTHAGQIIGSGTGPGGSSQYMEINWRKKMNRIGFSLERKANNNDFYVYTYTNSLDYRRFWIDFAATLKADWKIGSMLIGARISSIRSNNYQWWLYTPSDFYYVRGRDLVRTAGHLSLTYLLDKK